MHSVQQSFDFDCSLRINGGFFYWYLLTQIRMNDSISNNDSTKYFNSVRVGLVEIENGNGFGDGESEIHSRL